jgi:SAM-dependent methyltransferase
LPFQQYDLPSRLSLASMVAAARYPGSRADREETAMASTFDKEFWETHWTATGGARVATAANPHLVAGVAGLRPGIALDAGCGEGAEAIWLAEHDWQVVAADISTAALGRAAERAARTPVAASRLQWVAADLCVWEPPRRFDLVVTHYAHPALPQLVFYRRLADWVAPGGTLLIVGHLRHDHTDDQPEAAEPHHPPPEATVTADSIVAVLDPAGWEIISAEEVSRASERSGRPVVIDDVVVRARRRADRVGRPPNARSTATGST